MILVFFIKFTPIQTRIILSKILIFVNFFHNFFKFKCIKINIRYILLLGGKIMSRNSAKDSNKNSARSNARANSKCHAKSSARNEEKCSARSNARNESRNQSR